jgi:heat shock protein HslJ
LPPFPASSRRLGGLLLVALVLAACSPAAATPAAATPAPASAPTPDATTASGDLELAGTSWLLVGYVSPDGTSSTEPLAITPTLVFSDGTADGNAGCNTFSGTWTLDGSRIEFGEAISATKVACPDPGGQVETAYLANLALVDTAAIIGENLVLSQSDGPAALEFVPAGT